MQKSIPLPEDRALQLAPHHGFEGLYLLSEIPSLKIARGPCSLPPLVFGHLRGGRPFHIGHNIPLVLLSGRHSQMLGYSRGLARLLISCVMNDPH